MNASSNATTSAFIVADAARADVGGDDEPAVRQRVYEGFGWGRRPGRCWLWSDPGMRWLPPRHTGARDLLVAGVALVGGIGLLWLGTQPLVPLHPQVPVWAYLFGLVAASAGLALRRRAPLAGLAIGAAAISVDAALAGRWRPPWSSPRCCTR